MSEKKEITKKQLKLTMNSLLKAARQVCHDMIDDDVIYGDPVSQARSALDIIEKSYSSNKNKIIKPEEA